MAEESFLAWDWSGGVHEFFLNGWAWGSKQDLWIITLPGRGGVYIGLRVSAAGGVRSCEVCDAGTKERWG